MQPVSAHAVANAFLDLAWSEDRQLTNMQLQKLVYIAQGFALAILDKPLYFNETEAWQYGPVIPNLYNSLKIYGAGEVKQKVLSSDSVQKDWHFKIIKFTWYSYGKFSGLQLSALTHKADTPWEQVYKSCKEVIPTNIIREYYQQLIEEIHNHARTRSK